MLMMADKPLGNVAPNGDSAYPWRALASEPQFSILGAESVAGQWTRLEFAIRTKPPISAPAALWLDLGRGFSNGRKIEIFPDASGRAQVTFRAPVGLKALRLDPVGAICVFSIDRLTIRPMSSVRVFLDVLARELATGPVELLRKVWRALRDTRAVAGPTLRRSLMASLDRNVQGYGFLPDYDALENVHRGKSAISSGGLDARGDLLRRYADDLFARAARKSSENEAYVARSADAVEANLLPVQAIAFYLPQFHPIPENDRWWGKGFTEWTNVTNAVPQFIGHYQPHMPVDLGYYDLRVPEVMQQQVEMARHYGIYGFCFHYYWFGGKRLLELPIERFLSDPHLDLHFCFCWANENWTRRWDGLENEVLIAQQHSPQDDIALVDSMMAAFRDPRYIRIDDKPVLVVYRATLLPDAAATVVRWRQRAVQQGLAGLYLIAAKAFDVKDPRRLGFDAAVQFPPHQARLPNISGEVDLVNPNFKGSVHRYEDLVKAFAQTPANSYLTYRTVVPGWDNEARKPGAGRCLAGANPELYESWITAAAQATQRHRQEERLLFINAWNEWAEGAHLEPDRRNGYAYLQATANALRGLSSDAG